MFAAHFNKYYCFKLVKGFRVTCLFPGQYNTKGCDMMQYNSADINSKAGMIKGCVLSWRCTSSHPNKSDGPPGIQTHGPHHPRSRVADALDCSTPVGRRRLIN